MPFWVLLALQVGTSLLNRALRSRARQQTPKPSLAVPEVNDGDVLPVVFGTVKVPVRIVGFSEGDWRTEEVRSGPPQYFGLFGKPPVTAQRYLVSAVGVLCHGPVDAVTDWLFDNKSVIAAGTGLQYAVTYPAGGGLPSITATSVPPQYDDFGTTADNLATLGRNGFTCWAPTLLGGPVEDGGNGGVGGRIILRNGAGHDSTITELVAQHADTPDWRAFAHCYFDDFWMGNSPTVPALHAIVQRRPRGSLQTSLFTSGPCQGDANPAGILWELLTDPETGMGLPEALLDRSAFLQLRTALDGNTDLRFGLSFVLDQATTVESVVEDVLRVLDAVLYTNPTTGLLAPWLLRSPNDAYFGLTAAGGALTLSPSNVAAVEWTAPRMAGPENAVRGRYIDRSRGYTETSVTAVNHARVAETGQAITADVSFLGVSNEAMMRRLLERELRARTTKLGRAVIRGDRALARAVPGQWVSLTWPELGFTNRLLRVVDVDYGTLEDPTITIDATDDVYAMPLHDAARVVTEPWEPSAPVMPTIAPDLRLNLQDAPAGYDPGVLLQLALLDPQSRMTELETRVYDPTGIPSAWVSLTPPPATLNYGGTGPTWWEYVATPATGSLLWEYRLTWDDANGESQQLTGSVPISGPAEGTTLQGNPVSSAAPATGQVLVWNGTAWVPGTASGAGGAPSGPAGGDLDGTYPNPDVVAVQGTPVDATPPTAGDVLQFDGTAWVPTTLPSATFMRTTAVVYTGTIPAGGFAHVTAPLAKAFLLLSVSAVRTVAPSTAAFAWIRLYDSTTARTADASRALGTNPTPGFGVTAEVSLGGALAGIAFSPLALGASQAASPSTSIPLRVDNTGPFDDAFTITIAYIPLET